MTGTSKYTVQKSRTRQESIDGCAPLETCTADNLSQAQSIMHTYADGGQFYAAIFLSDGECIGETDDVD